MDCHQMANAKTMPPEKHLEPLALTPGGKSRHAPPEELRNLLEELQQVAENAIASSIESTRNAAIREAANTLDGFSVAKRLPQRNGRAVSTATHADNSVSVAPVQVDIAAGRTSDTALVEIPPKRNSVNTAHVEFHVAPESSPFAVPVVAYWRQSSRWTYVGISTIVLLTSVFVIFIMHLPHLLAAKPSTAKAPTAYHAEVKNDREAGSLTIVVQPNQTIEKLSSQYVGRFDYQVLEQIRALNPGLADPGHLEAGKKLKLPLPNAVRKK